MLMFLLSAAVGYFTPKTEGFFADAIKRFGFGDMPLAQGEIRTLAFVKLLGAVALAGWIFSLGVNAHVVLVGGALGLFGQRIFNILKSKWDAREASGE